MWEQLLGHNHQIEMFRRAINRGRTAHAYLFVGPSGIGKKFFAKLLTQCLFCERIPDDQLDACGECSGCKQVVAGTHPDLLQVACPEGKRELPISLIAGGKENRGREGLCHDIALRPMSAKRRIAIIDDAETMNEESANAFLKTLEEPPPGAVIFMIGSEIDQLLPTIRSRCQIVRFGRLSDDELKKLLLEHEEDIEIPEIAELLPFAEGSLTTARQLLDPGLKQLRSTVEKCVRKFPIESLASVAAVNAAFEELGGDTAKQRQNMLWANRFLIDTLRNSLRACEDPYQSDRLAAMLDRCFETEIHLKQAMPVPLCLEAMFDDLGRISRTAVPIG